MSTPHEGAGGQLPDIYYDTCGYITREGELVYPPAPPTLRVRYGPIERFYDTDSGMTRLVKKRYEIRTEGTPDAYEKLGRWDYVPASASEEDASDA